MKINRKNALFSTAVIIASVIIVAVSININGDQKSYFAQDFQSCRVTSVNSEEIEKDPYVPGRVIGRQWITIEILDGELKNKKFNIINNITKKHNVYAESGKKYICTIRKQENRNIVWLYNYNRAKILYILLFIFVTTVILIAGRQGMRSLLSLVFTAIMIIFVLIPLIFSGAEPLPFSILILSIVIIVSFLLISGFSHKTAAAISGTIFGIIIAGLISYIFSSLANLSGINMEKGEQILYIAKDYNIKVKGLLFISILIASLGAVMDVAMSISSSVFEIKNHKPEIKSKDLFFSGMAIGKDVIGTMINTLILAFAGSSFTLILMIAGLKMSYIQFINIPVINIEIIQALAGSIGILLTVPFTNIASIIIINRRGH